jgi:hypothetical protein
MFELLTLAAGILLRIGIPLFFTLIVAHLLKRLDERWRRESLEAAAKSAQGRVYPPIRCWGIRGFSDETCGNCPAFLSNTPCWEVKRVNGLLSKECLRCPVIQQALIPEGI